MNFLKKTCVPILLAAIWISVSEFFRNEFLLKTCWVEHYKSLGLVFPSEPVNGAMWGIWSLLYAIFVFLLSRKFALLQTAFIAWFAGFVLMWFVIGNLNVLPYDILYAAVPLSMLEAFVASLIIARMSPGSVSTGIA
jgi:hypothetical protein